jgi:hypothetical protein
MSNYDTIFDSLQQKLDEGSITLEEAELLNDIAYDAEENNEYTEGAYRQHVEYMNKNYNKMKADLDNLKARAENSTGKAKKQIEESIKRKEVQMKAETDNLHKNGVINSDEYAERQKHGKELGEGMRTSRRIERQVGNTAKGNSPAALAKRAVAGAKMYSSKEYTDAQKKIDKNSPEYFDQLNDKKKFNQEKGGATKSGYKDSGVAPDMPKRKLVDKATLNSRLEKASPGSVNHRKEIQEKLAAKKFGEKVAKEAVDELRMEVIEANLAGLITYEERQECMNEIDNFIAEE